MVQRATAKACDMAAKVDSILEKTFRLTKERYVPDKAMMIVNFLHPQDHFHTAKPSLRLD